MKCQMLQKGSVDTDCSEFYRTVGGCPVMGQSLKKRNPALSINHQGYEYAFVSRYRSFLYFKKADVYVIYKTHGNRKSLDSYGIHLQHTLFLASYEYQRIRRLECCSRLLPYEQLRQKGNYYYSNGLYCKAIDLYEQAASLFKWLEHNETVKINSLLQDYTEKSSQTALMGFNFSYENLSKELKRKGQEFLVDYNNNNIILYDGEYMVYKHDIDLRKSLLLQINLNLAVAYMQLSHYSIARKLMEYSLYLSDQQSQIYLRLGQSYLLCKSSSVGYLIEGRQLVMKSIDKKSSYKVYAHTDYLLLESMNLKYFDEVAQNLLNLAQSKITKQIEIKEDLKSKLYKRALQMEYIYAKILRAGRAPQYNDKDISLTELTYVKIIEGTIAEYLRIISFYLYHNMEDDRLKAKQELQNILFVMHQISQIDKVELDQYLYGVMTDKIKRRVNAIKQRLIEDIYNSCKYNSSILSKVILYVTKYIKNLEHNSLPSYSPTVKHKLPWMCIVILLLMIMLAIAPIKLVI